MQRILVAVDMTESSLRAADLAAELAAKFDAELLLVTVGRESMAPNPDLEAYARMEHIREPAPLIVTEALREDLVPIRDRAAKKSVRHISIDVYVGDPADQILACASAKQVDLIAVGSRGRGRLAGLLLGSVAQKVVALARCPVVVVH